MAGLKTSSQSVTNQHSFASKLIFLLTLLPITLAAFAFVLQWRGGGDVDPVSQQNSHIFPGMDSSPLATVVDQHSSSSDCLSLAQSSSPSFPFYHDWNFHFESDLKPKVFNLLDLVVFVFKFQTRICYVNYIQFET